MFVEFYFLILNRLDLSIFNNLVAFLVTNEIIWGFNIKL